MGNNPDLLYRCLGNQTQSDFRFNLKVAHDELCLQKKLFLTAKPFSKCFNRDIQYFKTLLFFFISILFFSLQPASGGSYSDNHNDNVLNGWTVSGKRTWSETGGYAIPNNSDQSYRGFLINDYPCSRDGEFTCRLKGSGDLNSLDGGVVFRFINMSNYYFVTISESNSSGQSSENQMLLLMNSTDIKNGYTVICSGLDFTDCNRVYTIKIRLKGPTFTFWLNGDSLGLVTDSTNMSGSVGYAYDDLPNAYIKFDSSAWVDANSNYFWDVSRSAGLQAGNGVWGIDNFWSPAGDNGTSLYAWPGGAGNSATFSGTDGNYTITVNDTLLIDSLSFLNSTCTISDGGLNFGLKNGIYVTADKIAIIQTVLSGTAGISKYGEGTLVLAANNVYKGTTFIKAGTLEIGNGGSSGDINGPIINNGILVDNRTNNNSIDTVISGPGKFVKTGTGILSLNGINSYTGTTTVASGMLIVNGSIATGSSVSVASGATLSGTGICSGLVTVNDGVVNPGSNESGKLSLGELRLCANSTLHFDLDIKSDTIAIAGALVLDGTIDFSSTSELPAGTYRIITYTGNLTNNTPVIGSLPSGLRCKLVYGNGYIDAAFTAGLITMEPKDTAIPVGTNASFTVAASGGNSMVYKWLRNTSDSVGNFPTYSIGPVTLAENGTRFRCVVMEGTVTDSSRWAVLTVIDTPRIVLQPQPANVSAGTAATFSLSVKDTLGVTYIWYKAGSDLIFGNQKTLTIASTVFNDSGDYYCIVSNPAGITKSDIVHLSVRPVELAASFSFNPKRGPVPLTVKFTDNSTGDIISRLWKFGDSSSSADMNPEHVYTKPGVYTIELMVTGPLGSKTIVKTDSIYAYDKDINPVNSIEISKLYFDSLTSSIRISWCIDSASLTQNPQVGITYSFTQFPTTTADNSVILISSCCTDTIIPLKEDVIPGTTYHIALWYRLQNGAWLEPVATSKQILKIGSIHYQKIINFFDSNSKNDTVVVLNGKVILWKDSTCSCQNCNTDTLSTISLPSYPDGLVPVGTPFIIKTNAQVVPFSVGIHIDSLPVGTSINDVRIYSITGSKFSVNYLSHIDTVSRFVYARTNGFDRSFIPMIDKKAPALTIYSNPATPVMPGTEVNDVIGINDNVTNVRWKYLLGRGDIQPIIYNQGYLDSSGSIIRITIPDTSEAICSESGLRILLVIDDGCHIDTLNLSRSVYRLKSDTMTTVANRWNPVYSTAILHSKHPDSILAPLIQYFKVQSYNNKYFRLFQWLSTENNSSINHKWVEYDPSSRNIQSLFTFEPGRMYWLKTREKVPMHMGSGYTISLRDTLTVVLQPRQWTDFSMPYKFSVRMKEIIAATGKDAGFVSIYCWKRDTLNDIYNLEPHYVPGMPDKESDSITIDCIDKGGYSIYNNQSKEISLRIPPLPTSFAQILKKSASTVNNSWSTKFVAQIDELINSSTVYIGYAPENYSYPVTPSFTDVNLSILDRATSRQYGHLINENARNGFVKELLVSNNGDSTHSLQYHFEKVGNFPENFITYCYNAISGNFDICGNITIAPHSNESRWIITGDAEFQKAFVCRTLKNQFSLHSIFPNPFRSAVNIRFAVPFGVQEHVTITIYNLLGKKVWQKRITTFLKEGLNQVTWNGVDNVNNKVGSGLYVVSLEVQDESGKVVKRFQQNATLLK